VQEEISCAACGFANSLDHRFCRRCGVLLEEYGDEPEQKLELALASKATKAPFTLIELLIILAIVGIMTAIAIPNTSRRSRPGHARQRACQANMRVIMGAIEMYNMDSNEMMRTLDSETMDRLLSGKYLKSPIIGAEKDCTYSSIGDMSEDGQVACSVHGTIDNPKPAEY